MLPCSRRQRQGRFAFGSGLGLVGLLTLLLWGGGCRQPSPPAATASPVRVVIAFAQPGPLPSSTPVGLNVVSSLLTNERLVQVGRDGRPEPALAKRWERSPDGRIWRLFLQPNLQFHDGTPLDAFHLVASLTPRIGAGLAGGGLPEGTTVTAENANTLTFTMRQPSSFLLEDLATMTIMSGGPTPVPAGPFQVVSTQADRISLRAFPHYYRGKSTVDTVELVAYPNARNGWSAMMRDEVDFLYDVTPEAVDFIEQSSLAEVKTFLRPYVYTVIMNMRHPSLGHREVRLALNEAVNRTRIIERVFRGRGHPASSHIWPKHWAYDHLLPRFRFVPADAVRRLDAAGFPMKATRSGRQKARFSFVALVPDADVRYERISLLLQQQLADVGIDMQLESVSLREMVTRLSKGNYDAALVDLVSTTGLNYVYTMWHSPQGRPAYLMDSGYTAADPALDRLLLATTDDDVRRAVRDLQTVMHTDPPGIFICWGETSRAVSRRFRLPPVRDRDILRTLPQWQLISTPTNGVR